MVDALVSQAKLAHASPQLCRCVFSNAPPDLAKHFVPTAPWVYPERREQSDSGLLSMWQDVIVSTHYTECTTPLYALCIRKGRYTLYIVYTKAISESDLVHYVTPCTILFFRLLYPSVYPGEDGMEQ